jgi:DNA helicase-4
LDIYRAIQEIQTNCKEIKRYHRLRQLRSLLKFLLFGFLIGKDADKRISELTNANRLLIKTVSEHFEELENLSMKIKEFADTYISFGNFEEEMKYFEKHISCANNMIFEMKELLQKHRRLVIRLKQLVEQRQHDLAQMVEKIRRSGTYLIQIEKNLAIKTIESLDDDLNYCKENRVLEYSFVAEEKKKLGNYLQMIFNYNKEFIERQKKEYSNLWHRGLLTLDQEQQTAIVTDDKHNLVIAAAGSGKTEVLITRIAYLIARNPDGVRPERILAIAYQRKAKEEIETRLHDRYRIEKVNVKTFHKLGKDILESAGEKIKRTDIIDENKKHEMVKSLFELRINNDQNFYNQFLEYVKTLHDDDAERELEARKDTLTYLQKHDYCTIDGTRVNSRAEKEIMDFLLVSKLNEQNIDVKYEPDEAGFRPDFYLPQYDLFIEHWAIDEKGEVPKHFRQSSEKYKEIMKTKKKWFTDNRRSLVETYTYEYDENKPKEFIEKFKIRIADKLREKCSKCNFTFKTYKEIIELAWKSCKTPVDDLVSYITTAKTYGLTPEKLYNRLANNKWTPKQATFGRLAIPIYQVYEQQLRESNKLDFEDMINRAIVSLENDKNLYAGFYDQILVDEYQDISAQRLRLLKKLLEHNPSCKLFCVGDDWQSIMGFSGSNLNFFVNFEQYVENPAITIMSTNYRSVKSIVDAGAALIRKNTSCQIQKPSLSSRKDCRPIRVFQSLHRMNYETKYYWQIARDCLTRIDDFLQKGYKPMDILVLTRYIRTRVGSETRFPRYIQTFIKKANEIGIEIVCDNTESRRKIRLLTVHRSKGLEAKVVFILNMVRGTYGFPCEIEDSTIFEPARENYPPQSQKEEERRLLYVAMTRAKEDLIIYTWQPTKSEFLDEIRNYTDEISLDYRSSYRGNMNSQNSDKSNDRRKPNM